MKQKIFAVLTVAALLLGSAIVAKTAVSTIAGLAVAQSTTVWNSVKDAALGDNLTKELLIAWVLIEYHCNLSIVINTIELIV